MVQMVETDARPAMRDTIYAIAEHFVRLRSEQVPARVVEATKLYVLDCLGVTIAGSSAAGCQAVAAQVAEWGGRAEATVLTFGHAVPAFLAAFANSTMARAMDLDDVYEPAICHVTSSVLPVALAMAELTGRVDGREFVAAVALGRDLMCRLSIANRNRGQERGRSQSYQYNTFSSAAVAGRYLELDVDQMVAAFGLAYGQGLSNRQGVIDGSMAVRVHQGLCAQLGTQAAQLAKRGVTGARNVIDGKYGYYNLYEDGLYEPADLTDALGVEFRGIDSSIKPYPCCKQGHTSVQATADLVRELEAKPHDIERIDVGYNLQAYYTICDPPEGRYAPRTPFDAQFSGPWAVATAAVKGGFTLNDLLPAALQDETVRAVARRVTVRIDEEIERDAQGSISPAVVKVLLKDGRQARRRVDYVKGHPRNPMNFSEVADKFRSCLPHAARPRDPARMEAAISLVAELERVPDVRELIRLLAEGAQP